MAIAEKGLTQRSRRLVCTSGDTRFFVVPTNKIGQATAMEVDTSALSGLFGVITLDVRDSYQAIDGSSTTTVRKSTAVKAGDTISIVLDGEFHLMGGIDIRTNFTGAIVSLSAAFR